MRAAETYAGGGEHAGHTVTVIRVWGYPPSFGPDPDQGGPDVVDVVCSCGARWSFEDHED